MRDRLIHLLRLARGRWYQYRDKPSLEEALADAILAAFVAMDRAEHARMEAEVAIGRVDKHINECAERGIGWPACRHCGHHHETGGICIS